MTEVRVKLMEDNPGSNRASQAFCNVTFDEIFVAPGSNSGDHNGEKFEAFYSSLLRRLEGIGLPREIAEDAIQDALLKATEMRLGGRLAEIRSPEAWLFRVALRKAYTVLRRRFEYLIDGLDGFVACPRSDVDDADENELLRAAVRDAMRRLPINQLRVIEECFFEDRTIEAAAAVLGMTLGEARGHYTRAKAALRSILRPARIPGNSRDISRFRASA